MIRFTRLPMLLGIALVVPAVPTNARGTAGLQLVNATGQSFSNLYIRRTGTQSWQPLAATPAKPPTGGKASASFTDPDCAFDLKVTLEDTHEVVWSGVNLCEVKSVTLNRNASGALWVDYD